MRQNDQRNSVACFLQLYCLHDNQEKRAKKD